MRDILELLKETGFNTFTLLPFAAVGVVLLGLFAPIYNWLTPYDDKAEIRRGNNAAAITRAGAFLGILVASSGSLIGSPEPGRWGELGMFALDGLIAVVIFGLLFKPMDAFVLRKVENSLKIEQGNLAVAWVEFSLYVGQGIIMSAAFSGAGQGLWWGMLSALLFSVIGQATLAVVYWLFVVGHRLEKVTSDLTGQPCPPSSRDIEAEIEAGHLRPAIDIACTILAVAITLWFSISGDFQGWWQDILSYVLAAVASIVAVSITREGFERLLARLGYGCTPASAIVVGLVTIGTGFIVGLVTFMG